jgi:cyclic-di-GMP phosphodiesterase TipF (flagellum assembly factor)
MLRLDQMVVPGMALIAGIVTAAVLYRVGATGAVGAILVVGLITIVAAFSDFLFAQLAENARSEAALKSLGKSQQTMRAEAELTRRALLELKQHVDDSISSRNDRVVTEVKVLESLIRRLAESVAERSREYEPSAEDAALVQPRHRGAAAPAGSPRDAMLDMIRRALEDNRVELYLQPIVSLPQRRVRFYEALSRLRTEDGRIIMPSQYIKIAEPAGLMSIIDNMLLFRCVQALQTWGQRNREIGVFINLSRETLQDRGFFSQFIEYLEKHRELAGMLVFEISQEIFETLTQIESTSLAHLCDLGFTLSIDKVTTLDFDFGAARARRVRYFKVPASLMLGDPETTGARIHPADLKQLLQRFGLNLIAERIEYEREVLGVLDYHVDYGQGFLFGEPKPLRDVIMDQGLPTAAAPRPARQTQGPRQVTGGRAA